MRTPRLRFEEERVYDGLFRLMPVLGAVLVVNGILTDGLLAAGPLALMGVSIGYLVQDARHRRTVELAEVADLHLRTIEALAGAIDAKDNTTEQHLQLVVRYAEAIGRRLKLGGEELKALRAAAFLHDIGKLAVPEYIVSKPGRLTEEEFEKMKIHTVVGAEIIERARFPYPVSPIVRSHHERWNGSGYPDGLRSTEIPLGARILGVVDSFVALACDQPYRRGLAPREAIAAIQREAGELYDPCIVQALEEVHSRIESAINDSPQPETNVSADIDIEARHTPKAGLPASDDSSALGSIARARRELQVLYELNQALGSSLSVEETLRLLTTQLQKLIHFEAIAVYLIRDGNLVPRFAEGVNASLLSRHEIPLRQDLSGSGAGNGKGNRNGIPAVESGYVPDPMHFSELRSALSVPLDSSKGIIGALTLYSVRRNAFAADHLRILKAIGIKAGSSINNALVHEEAGRSAETDGLTGLPNGRALWKRLEQETARAVREGSAYSVFVADLNGLKRINDRFGHLRGNKAIQTVAGALRNCLREYDFLARMGGDEFVILLPGMHAKAAAEKGGEFALAIDQIDAEFADAELSISVGSATFPTDSTDVEQLLGLADRHMYRHKREYYRSRSSATAVVNA